jgi:hypothetical protein
MCVFVRYFRSSFVVVGVAVLPTFITSFNVYQFTVFLQGGTSKLVYLVK